MTLRTPSRRSHPATPPLAGTRILLGIGAFAAVSGLLAACGSTAAPGAAATGTATTQASASTSAAPAATPSPAGSSGAGAPACLAASLQPRLGQSQGTAGTIYQVVVLVNTSASTCTLDGYPGVSFVTGVGGSQIGAPATKNPAIARSLVSLAPGGKASMVLAVHDAGAFPRCRLTSTSWLRIYPPEDYGSVYVQYKTQACAKKAQPTMSVTAVRTGAGSASF